MIASWIAYTIAAGGLLALAATLLERPLASVGVAMRVAPAIGLALCAAVAGWAAVVRPSSPLHEHTVATRNVRATVEPIRSVPSGVPLPEHRSTEGAAAVSAPGETVDESAPVRSWDRPLLVAWLSLSAVLAARLLAGFLSLRRLARRAERAVVDGNPVRITDNVGPASLVAPRVILLPRWALRLDPPARALAIQHEREHLAARDPLLLLAANAIVILLPWHLAAWWLLRRLRQAVEIDCDTRVLARNADRRRYAELLLLVARRSAGVRIAPVGGAVFVPLRPTASSLHRRIDTMTRPKRKSPLGRALQLAAAVGAAVVVFFLPQPPGLRAASVAPTPRGDDTAAAAPTDASSAASPVDSAPATRAEVPVSTASLDGADASLVAPGPASTAATTDSVVFGNVFRIPARVIASRDLFTRGVLRFERDSITWKGDTASYPGVALLRFADEAFDVEFEILPYDPYLEVRTREESRASVTPLICSLKAARIRFSRAAAGAPLRMRAPGTQWHRCGIETDRENWRGLVRATSRPEPPGPDADRVIVRLTDVGLQMSGDEAPTVQIFATGPARAGIGDAPMQPLRDTLRLDGVPAMALDITDADVHVRLVSAGQLRLGGEITGGPARRVAAQGREVIFRKGGKGIMMAP